MLCIKDHFQLINYDQRVNDFTLNYKTCQILLILRKIVENSYQLDFNCHIKSIIS